MRPAAPGAARDTGRERRQLRRFILIDLGVTTGATVFLVIVHLTVSMSIFVLVAAGATAVAGMAMAVALIPLGQGRIGAALNLMAGANWGIAVVATVVAPFGMPILMIVSLVPAALAVPFVDRVRLRRYAIGTIAVASAVVAAGTLQDASGIEDGLPAWIPTLTILLFTPVMAGLVVVTIYQAIEALNVAYTDAVRSRDELAEAQSRIVRTADDARRRIERDLHDGAQQRLTALAIGLGRIHARAEREGRPEAGDLADLRGHLADARTELRRLAHGLYPSSLAADGLEMALRSEADRFELPVRVQCHLDRPVPVEIQTAIYFCCLEAIQNAVTHGQANKIDIEVRMDGDQVGFAVGDDGIGFDPGEAASGQGLTNMRDRLGAFGGHLRIEAGPGRPTMIQGWLPLGAVVD